MYGKNIIGTDEALEGYELDYNRMGGKCNSSKEFIDTIQAFIDNPRPRFNTYSRNTFLEKYSAEKVVDSFLSILYQ